MIGAYHRLHLHVLASWWDVARAASRRLIRTRAAIQRKRSYWKMLDHHRAAQDLVRHWRL